LKRRLDKRWKVVGVARIELATPAMSNSSFPSNLLILNGPTVSKLPIAAAKRRFSNEFKLN
jgi:hypothetical protein